MSDVDGLTDLFRRSILAIVDLANEKFEEAKVPIRRYSVFWLEPTSPTGSSGKSEQRYEPAFYELESTNPDFYNEITENVDVTTFISNVAKLVEEKGHQVAGWSHDPAGLAERVIAVYFDRVGYFDVVDAVINEVMSEFVEDLTSKTAIVSTVYLVEGFDATTAFNLTDAISFRNISETDIDRYGRSSDFGWPQAAWTRHDRPWLNTNDWICEVQRISPKDTMKVINEHHEFLEAIVNALALSASGRAGFTLLANQWRSTYVGAGVVSGGTPVYSSRLGTAIELDDETVQKFRTTYTKVGIITSEKSHAHLKLPLRRLRLASERTANEDRLVDYVIGLENLLSCDSPNLETTFRFRIRGAVVLPVTFGTASERIKLMADLYDLRSRIVHGNASPDKVNEFVAKAETVFKQILEWYIGRFDSVGNSKKIVKRIDEVIVGLGSEWAYVPDAEYASG